MCFLGEPFKHDLFVSYSHGDADGSGRSPLGEWSRDFVADLERQLRQIHLFREVSIFLDQNERPGRGVDPTEPLSQQLKEEISASALLVVLMTPHYLASTWCTQERDWWLERVARNTIGAGGHIFVCRVLPNVTIPPWKPEEDDGMWPDALKDSVGHTLTGFWFHTREDVHFDTVPFKWDGSTHDTNEYNTARRLLIRHITIRLAEIRQKLEEQRRDEDNRTKLMQPGVKMIYLHARERQRQSWQRAREALVRSGYLVYPAAPEPNLLDQPLLNLKEIREARQKRIFQLAECDAILMLCSDTGAEIEIDLPAIGRNDRESARDISGKLLPCAVLDQVGQPIEAATALAIEHLDGCHPGWELHVASWLERCGRTLEAAA
jgi:hypothetical protein